MTSQPRREISAAATDTDKERRPQVVCFKRNKVENIV